MHIKATGNTPLIAKISTHYTNTLRTVNIQKMKKLLLTMVAALLIAAAPTAASAQVEKLPQIYEIAEVTDNGAMLQAFSMIKDSVRTYYLTVGNLGIGNEVVQFNIDPFSNLYIPLGNSLDEAVESLERIKAMYKEPNNSTSTIKGCLEWAFPGKDVETVTVVHTKNLLSNSLRFSVEREGYLRATYVDKSNFNSIVSSVKFYRKMHKRERENPNKQ